MNKKVKKRTDWFMEARFGMFIHWGLYSIAGKGEWYQSNQKIEFDEYKQYFDSFNPKNYDAKKWAKLAKEAGMKYAVMTAKHHDGFCLFDSSYTNYKSTNTKANRDLIKEFVEAFRAEGIKVGLYYSLLDWHHPDYPAYNDRSHPLRDDISSKDRQENFDNYIAYFHGQVKELLTNYGEIDIMWFDYSYDDMQGEKWEASKLVNMMRSIHPNIIIDNRLEGSGASNYGSIASADPKVYAGDFTSPEHIIPPKGIVDYAGNALPWESCITLNNSWAYSADDIDYKSSKQIIRGLVECTSKNGNLLLNVGPTPYGELTDETIKILSGVGEWMCKHSDSIYGCGSSELEKPEWGRYTQKGNKLYAHILDKGISPINLRCLKNRVSCARVMKDGSEIILQTPWYATTYQEDVFINFTASELPDDHDTVVEMKITY